MNTQLIQAINTQRALKGFLSLEGVIALCERGNIIPDPFSVLISTTCVIGKENVFYPSVIVECTSGGTLEIGDQNIFFPTCLFIADRGTLLIGNKNQFGDGGCTFKANRSQASIQVGNNGRYANDPIILGNTTLGSGSQIIGSITVQDCTLEAGKEFSAQDPDNQGAVLKGHGLARGLTVGKGRVVNGQGVFLQQQIELQSAYHPKT